MNPDKPKVGCAEPGGGGGCCGCNDGWCNGEGWFGLMGVDWLERTQGESKSTKFLSNRLIISSMAILSRGSTFKHDLMREKEVIAK